ncbi:MULTISPECIES: M23 family metallopeptidase [Alphaproteobacteria]|jgi:murein DD-endopeptidase MepM/ murein hydrolase activator NlpD|uniref:M23 family metallopeptidase n=1 Tax=Alphaproteobacteria TaxID=28211 RepID=UPI000A36594C|nr:MULTISPECIES: M23 family metallopeptidase [Alphaproteobacteria]MBC7285593.1 peptidoglycan DD-metalloendopeptidase family protein [Hoeflea sp.]
MTEKRHRILRPVSALLERLFVDRQIILRSEGHTRYFLLPRRTQMISVAVLMGLVGYVVVATVGYVEKSRIMMSKDESVERSQLAYRNLLDQVANYRESIVTITKDLREKQAFLRQLFEQNESLKQNLNTAESQLKQTETERKQIVEGRMAMRDQMMALENEVKNMNSQNVGLEKHMAMLRGKLSDAEAAAANLDQTRSQQAAMILDLRKRLALEQTRTERMDFEMASMRQDLQKAMSDRGEIVGEKETLHTSIEQLERQIAEMKIAHHEALRRFAERTLERIAFAEDLIAKTGVPVFDLLPGPPPPPPPPRELAKGPQGGPFVPYREESGIAATRGESLSRAGLRAVSLEHLEASIEAQMDRWEHVQNILVAIPFAAPMTEYALSSGFGPRSDPFSRRPARHEGLDFTAPYKSDILVTAPGIVRHAGWRSQYGRLVEVDHGNGLSTRYAHLAKVTVKVGEKVEFGDVIGLLGSSGRSTGPHLHYEILVNGRPYDPLKFIKAGQHVLKSQ